MGEHGWLHTRYSFSFADWHNPLLMGFGKLRVLNDDIIDARHGFGAHSHRNMEIITIVTEGAVAHKDSMGNDFSVPAGDVQVMSAGTGVTHSESNDSDSRLALFQIWIEPREMNITPSYAQKQFGLGASKNTLELLAAPNGGEGALPINQDAYVLSGYFDEGNTFEYKLHAPHHGVYVFVVEGVITVADEQLSARDAIGVWGETSFMVTCTKPSKVLLFEVPL